MIRATGWRPRPQRLIAIGAGLLCAASLALFWPGVATFDSVGQYGQLLAGAYDDWHPPAMARLWSVFHALGLGGQAPMFVLQTLLSWGGLGLIAAALAASGARRAAVAVLLLGVWPPIAGWQAVVVKDSQMAAALLAATGLVAHRRLRGLPLGGWTRVAVLVLLAYATLVRANAVFATAPLAVALLAGWSWRGVPVLAALVGAVAVATLALSPAINHGLLGARSTGVETTLPIYDLAGIAHHAGAAAVPALPPATWRRAEAGRCLSPILWDPLASDQRCAFVQAGLEGRPRGAIFAAWTAGIRSHPGAYAAHRLAHWNSTMRLWVPWHFPLAEPPAGSEPNDLGLGEPGPAASWFDSGAGWLADSPLGAPILALATALAVLALARPTAHRAHELAVALALSATAMELSFLLVSISSDWRYHLWSILAAGLAAILLTAGLPRRGAWLALAALALVAGTCLVGRVVLPSIGDDYADAVG